MESKSQCLKHWRFKWCFCPKIPAFAGTTIWCLLICVLTKVYFYCEEISVNKIIESKLILFLDVSLDKIIMLYFEMP